MWICGRRLNRGASRLSKSSWCGLMGVPLAYGGAGMKKDILIVKNITRETAAGMQPLIEAHHDSFDVVELDLGQSFPDPREYRAVIVLGGPDSANDQTEKMQQEIVRVQEVLAAGIPYLGICLGLQVLVKAAGGEVMKSSLKEVGFRDPKGEFFRVELTEAGVKDPLLKGVLPVFKTFELHGEMVKLLPGMQLLGRGEFCEAQIVKVAERAYGFQCHFEGTWEWLQVLLQKDPDLQRLDAEALRTDYVLIQEEYHQIATRIVQNFLAMAGI